MDVEDVSSNPKIARLTRLTRELEQSRTAEQTMRALRRGFSEGDDFIPPVLLSTRGLPPGDYRVVPLHVSDEPPNGDLHPAEEQPGPVHSGGIMAAIISRCEPQLIQNVDWSHDPYFHETLDGCTSVIALPLASARLPMNWVIRLKKAPERFTVSRLEEEVERTALAGALLENQILAGELARANEQIENEAREVGELQRALLPASLPRIAGLEMATSYEPSGRAGGDLFDFFPLDEPQGDHGNASAGPTRWCIFIGDAAGHGLATAVIMAIVQAVLHARPIGISGPASLLMHANRQLCTKGLGGFVTAFLGLYEPTARRLTYANAGHPPPLVRRSSDGLIRALDQVGSFPLGIDDSETFKEATVQLERGDMVLLYTDGITEARSRDDDLFDSDRLLRVLRDGGDRPAAVIDRLRSAVRTHEIGEPPRDDQAVVAMRVL